MEGGTNMDNTNRRKRKQVGSWKNWHQTKEGTVDEDMPKLAKKFKQYSISKILDLGCGSGRHSVFFAEKGFEVFGFDFSEDSVNRAKEILQRLNLCANLKVWDMTHSLPYDDQFFDAVISTRVFHHSKMETIKRVIAEIKRVLREGGYVYIQVPMMEKVQKYIEQGGKFDEIEPGTFVPLEGSEKGIPHHNFTREELLGLFNDFKVKNLTERDEHYNLLAIKKSSS